MEKPEELSNHKFRMYRNPFPEVGDIVVARIVRVEDDACYASLLEYGGLEGMLQFSELSNRRIKSLRDHVKIDAQEILQVIRVEPGKGYIDLSKKRVTDADRKEAGKHFARVKMVHSVMSHLSQTQGLSMEELYTVLGWPLSESSYGDTYDAFAASLSVGIDEVLKVASIQLSDELKQALVKLIRAKFAAKAVSVQAEIEVTCFTEEGIDAIRPALRSALAFGTPAEPVKVQVKSAPEYLLFISTQDEEFGVKELTRAIEAVKAAIEASRGTCAVRIAPHVVANAASLISA